jgi:hypothetical protein
MQEIFPPRPKLDGQFGWLSQLSWGHGMIGKATVALVVLLAILGIGALRVPSEFGLLLILGAAMFGFVVFLAFIGWFAISQPDLAATEGPTYVQSRQIALGAKNTPVLPNTDMVPDPQNPTLINPRGAE